MEIWQKLVRYRTLIIVFVLLSLINVFAAFAEDILLFRIAKLIAIPTLLILYFNNMRYMANVFFFTFIFFFLGDLFVVFNFNEFASQLSMGFYTLSYLLLIFVLFGKLKRVRFEGLVSMYLILVFLLNSYFLYVLYEVIQDSLTERINLILIVCRGISLIGMSFLAFAVYLSRESKQSIIFLTMAFCFVFSDVLYFVNTLYVYYWLFELLDKLLHLFGFTMFFIYVTNHHRISKYNCTEKHQIEDSSEQIITQ